MSIYTVGNWEIRCRAYGDAVSRFGFTPVPNLLIWDLKAFGLSPSELVFLLGLLSRLPADTSEVAASIKQMAKQTGICPTTLHAAKDALTTKGFIRIVLVRKPERTNTYDLKPLFEKLEVLASGKAAMDPKVDSAAHIGK